LENSDHFCYGDSHTLLHIFYALCPTVSASNKFSAAARDSVSKRLGICGGSTSGFDDSGDGADAVVSATFLPILCFFFASSRAVFSASAISFSIAVKLLFRPI